MIKNNYLYYSALTIIIAKEFNIKCINKWEFKVGIKKLFKTKYREIIAIDIAKNLIQFYDKKMVMNGIILLMILKIYHLMIVYWYW